MKYIARFLALPRVADFIIRFAIRHGKPDHLGGYMLRYQLIWGHLRVHKILRADEGPYLHDHPADFRTFVLKGAYQEQDVFGCCRVRFAGDTYKRRAHEFHQIKSVEGPVWTLFIFGRRYNPDWGFMVNDRKISHEAFGERN